MARAASGTDPAAAPRERAATAFRERFGRAPELLVRAPGRANLLGAHVDYSEGWVLPGAIEPSVWLAAAAGAPGLWEVVATDLGAAAGLEVAPPPPPRSERRVKRPDAPIEWHDYLSGLAWVLARAGHAVPGLRAAVASDLPIGAGVSSSAALEVAFLLAVGALSGEALSGLTRARLGRAVENDYLGVQSGIMDQYASLHGKADHLLLLDCRVLEHQEVPLPAEARVLLADTGVRRRLAGTEFSNRRAECQRAVELLRVHLPGIRTLRDVPLADLDRLLSHLPAPLDRRARHAVEECARVREGAERLRAGDLAGVGELMRLSHLSSRDLYEVSIPELDRLAEAAWEAGGCWGARLTGGGFGGCVLALVHRDEVGSVGARLAERFERAFGRRPAFLCSRIADGARVELQ